jgi:heterodisulfide reductase subunit D
MSEQNPGAIKKVDIPVMSEVFLRGERPEYLFWVGCAGAFDDRYRKVARAFAKILSYLEVSYAVLGKEESCTGDPARRAGNEMIYQMQALRNIEIFTTYEVKKILTICPHCFNILKNEYPDLGGNYEVINYLHFLDNLIHEGTLKIDRNALKNARITYHDPCYLGRCNDIYAEPRSVLSSVTSDLVEMRHNKSFALCCGAGGGQMFKEAEKGNKEVYLARTEEALETNPDIIATACPFCMIMLTDGLKYKNKEEEVKNYDIAELIVMAMGL